MDRRRRRSELTRSPRTIFHFLIGSGGFLLLPRNRLTRAADAVHALHDIVVHRLVLARSQTLDSFPTHVHVVHLVGGTRVGQSHHLLLDGQITCLRFLFKQDLWLNTEAQKTANYYHFFV